MNREYECRMIYREAFCDPDTDFENLLFETCYKYCKTFDVSGEVASMLFALPCSIDFSGEKEEAIYLYAAATAEKHRKKGYMARLIRILQSETDDIIILRPATDELIGFYEKFGFKSIETSNKNKIKPFVTPKGGYRDLVFKIYGNIENTAESSKDFTVMYYSKNKKEINKIYFVNSME